jgi:hypothetical protein
MGMRYRRGRTARIEPSPTEQKLRNFVKACWGVSCNLKVLNEGGLITTLEKNFSVQLNFDREHIKVFFRKFRIVSFRFETVLFVSVVSIQVRNTETNRKYKILVSRNKPK